ncbi:MAG: hypothetical protein ABIJ04_12640 [Bacteroidota bacterium]
MLSEEKINRIVEDYIRKTEKLGDLGGGSGHMSYVSFRIDDIKSRNLDGGKTEISFSYTLMVETEFTYYPDNPPYEYPASGTLLIESNDQILG